MAINKDLMAIRYDLMAINKDFVAIRSDFVAINKDLRAIKSDLVAINKDFVASGKNFEPHHAPPRNPDASGRPLPAGLQGRQAPALA